MLEDMVRSPAELLVLAADHDARRARRVTAALDGPRLLEMVLTQAQLAVEPGRPRPAGVDALAELDRAAVEVMGITPGIAAVGSRQGAAGDGRRDARTTAADPAGPVVTGWELLTLGNGTDLAGATMAVPARPWHLGLIAFAHRTDAEGRVLRWVTAALADGRLVTARLRLGPGGTRSGEPVTSRGETVTVLGATVTADLADLGSAAPVAFGLACALASAARAA